MGCLRKELRAIKKEPNENSGMETCKIWKNNNWTSLTEEWTLKKKKTSMNLKYKKLSKLKHRENKGLNI